MIPKEPTHVEKQVLTDFRSDGISVVDVDDAEISGDFLRGLFLGKYDTQADYRGTCIENAIISDVFDMEFCETKFPLRFLNCHFEKAIRFQQLTCPELNFAGCTLKNGINALYAKVDGGVFLSSYGLDGKNSKEFRAEGEICLACSDIGGQLICIGKVFKNGGKLAFIAQGAKVANDLALCGEFKGEVCLTGAKIGGQLNCGGGNFLGGQTNREGGKSQNENDDREICALNAQNIKVAGDVMLGDGFNAEGMVTLLGADVGGQLNCSGGNFRNKNGNALIAQGINVAGNVFLGIDDSNSSNIKKFEAVGAVSLAYADIKGQLACNGGIFRNKEGGALNAQGIKVAGEVLLRDGFKAEGEVRFLGADVGGQFVCIGGTFLNEKGNALIAQGLKVGAGACLGAGFNAKGAVTLAGAEIRGQLDCRGGNFQNQDGIALNAQGIKVASEVFLIPHVNAQKEEMFAANGLVSFTNAIIGGSFLLKGCKLAHLSLAGANVLGEFQDDADAYKLDEDGRIDLNIDGFRYQRLGDAKEREKDRLEWVGLMSEGDEFRPQPYEQLMKVYREMGHMNWARDAGFALEEKRRKVMDSRWWKAWYWLLRHTIGYGYKPFRVVTRWFLPVIVGGSLFLGVPCTTWENSLAVFAGVANPEKECWIQVSMLPSDAEVLLSENWKNHKNIPTGHPRFIPFFYAVEVALPVLPLGQTETWHPENPLIKFIQEIITIVGALVLAILASYGVGVLGPRWKDE